MPVVQLGTNDAPPVVGGNSAAPAAGMRIDANATGIEAPGAPPAVTAVANTPVVNAASPVSPLVTLLGTVQATLGTVPRVLLTGSPIEALREWWFGDAIRMSGVSDHENFNSMDRDCYHGLMRDLYDYRPQGNTVDVRARWVDVNPGWYALEDSTVGREVYGYPANLVNAVERAGTGDWTPLTQILRTRSWSLDGTGLVNFSRLLGQTMAAKSGFSPATVFTRIFGYILSGLMPTDKGGPGAAVMTDPLARSPTGPWFPVSGQGAQAVPAITAVYVTTELFVRWQLGQVAIGDFAAADVDRGIIVVPVDHEFLIRPAALAVLAIGMMEYPVRNLCAHGNLFDLVGPLTRPEGGANVPFASDWFPASTLVRIRGPGTGVANSVRVMFVRSSGNPMAAGGPEVLALPNGVNINLTVAGAAVIPAAQLGNFGQCLELFFGDNVNHTQNIPHFWEGFMRATSLFGAGQAITTMIQFWSANCTLWCRPWESCGAAFEANRVITHINGIAPRHSEARGVVKEVVQVVDTNPTHPSWVVMNSIGQLWNIRYPDGGGNGVRDAGAVHWYLPAFSSIYGAAVAAGVLVPDPLSEPLAFAEVTDLVACVLKGGMAYTALADVYFVARNTTREMFHCFLGGAPPRVANAAFLRGTFGNFWGHPGSRSLRNHVSACDSFRNQVFLNKIAPFFPLNGVVFSDALAGYRDCGLDTSNLCGGNVFGRLPAPTLSRYLEVPFSGQETSSFGEAFFASPVLLRNVANTTNEYGCVLTLAQRDWERTWKQSRELAGCFGAVGAATLGALASYSVSTPTQRKRITTMSQSDTAVISVAGGPDGVLEVSDRFGFDWDNYRSPTLDRPLSPVDYSSGLTQGLVCTNRALARSRCIYFFPRIAYDLPLSLADWIDNATDARGLLDAIGMNPF